MKKVQCEMGGKNPVIVLEDADLELAATGTVQGAFGSTGQRCTATSRAIVVSSVAAEFTRLVVEKARALKVGDGTSAGVNIGPVRRRGAVQDRHELPRDRQEGGEAGASAASASATRASSSRRRCSSA